MNSSNRGNLRAILFVLAGGLLLGAMSQTSRVVTLAQTPAAEPKPATEQAVDKYDRQWTLADSQRAGYASGWQRGQELYYMKCWNCHNEYTILSDRTGSPAPSLRDIAKRMKAPQIRARILSGAGRMPSYSANLSENDINDLVTYLLEKCGTFKTGGGCFDEHNPPPNPLYLAK